MRAHLPRLLAVTGLATLLLCCSSGGGRTPGYRPHSISEEELSHTSATTALEAIQRLRPDWLRRRGQTSFRSAEPIIVYINSHFTGQIDALAQLPIGQVRSMEFLDGIAATQRFGTNHGSGAILVSLRH